MAPPRQATDKDGKDDQYDKARRLAALVTEHRESAGYSQREFAVLASVSRSTLSRIEKGELFPSGRVRRKLAKAMNVSPARLWRPGDGLEDRAGQAVSGEDHKAQARRYSGHHAGRAVGGGH